MSEQPEIPTLLCVGGHDPCGGAGIVADLESARAAGIHAASVISVLTSQDSCGVRALWPQPAEHVAEQCRTVLADSAVAAIKVGLLGSSAVVRVLAQLAEEHPELPLVLDPVLASGAGQPMADAALLNQLRNNLLGRATLVTPNLPEARTLGCASEPEACARRLLEGGCRWALITGTHGEGPEVVNRLYGRDGGYREWSWARLPHDYHGSGCTLASAIAARLAKGADMIEAVDQAQAFTWHSLQTARRTGRCQLTPNRLHALDGAEEQAPR
jgi:hydroxymethylpyrimidine/phosphomethylpyrimidine kinase